MKYIVLSFLLGMGFCSVRAQKTDSIFETSLPDITITAFEQQKSRLAAASSQVAVSLSSIDRTNRLSLVTAFNSLAGVRMEERSPGSYRLNIRGSSLRAPFGVRNVKIYWNDIPVTDAGGGTYLNQFAFNNIANIEIAKGPAGSLYGAGTGGLVLLQSLGKQSKPGFTVDLAGGSFGMFQSSLQGLWGQGDNINQLSYTHSTVDGYRQHTLNRKDNFVYSGLFTISDRQKILASVLFNHIYYETPGGLNATEFANNPRQERPAAGAFPSASVAKAAIDQTNFIAGLSHRYQISDMLNVNTVLFGTFNHIKNPTFRNYERRIEPGFGARTVLNLEKKWTTLSFKWTVGGEGQRAYYNTQVSRNRSGSPDTLQTNDDIDISTYSLFTQASIDFGKDWSFVAGTSLNRSSVSIRRLNVYPVVPLKRIYRNEFAPRVSVVKQFGKFFSLSGSFSQGFSPPSISELLPSTGEISTFLEAERGNNYELGARLNLLKSTLQIDLTGFYFRVKGALVVRRDINNADFFVNAGDTKQRGIEGSVQYLLKSRTESPLVSLVTIRSSHSLYRFTFGSYQKDITDYSGNRLPGVPGYTGSLNIDVESKKKIIFSISLFRASSLYLNDANTVKDQPYTLVGSRLNYKVIEAKRLSFTLYGGVDNLFDEAYSLGNDINAAGGRFYNTAPGRNWYAGLRVSRP